MSDRYIGGIVNATGVNTSKFGVNSGMFTLGQQLNAVSSGEWSGAYTSTVSFKSSTTWECPEGVSEVEYLIVAGGGPGGDSAGGGGGGGGVRQGSGLPVVAGKSYTCTIGSGGSGHPASSNGGDSGFLTEGQSTVKTYYVSVGNPGAGDRYYIKEQQNDSAEGNVAAVTQKLYEGSTYKFDQSHPTNSTHPFAFSTNPNNSPSAPYTTGVTTSGTAGTDGYTQIAVASPAPDLYYYCTAHPNMGGAAETLANVSIKSNGGGQGGGSQSPYVNAKGANGGSGGGGKSGFGSTGGPTNVGGNSLTFTAANGHQTPQLSPFFTSSQGSNGSPSIGAPYSGGGGGGAGGDAVRTPAPLQGGNGGQGITSTISGISTFYAGGGGGGAGNREEFPTLSIGLGGEGGGGDGNKVGNGGVSLPTIPRLFKQLGTVNSGGGGGGGADSPNGNKPTGDPTSPGSNYTNATLSSSGGTGGSGIMFLRYKETSKSVTFKSTTSWSNLVGAKKIDYLIVAGGGSGGYNGGGGGAGGVIVGTGLDVEHVSDLTITVGAGGTGAGSDGYNGGKGTSSSIVSPTSLDNINIVAFGGGGGGSYNSPLDMAGGTRSGGSGGGGGNGPTATKRVGGFGNFGNVIISTTTNTTKTVQGFDGGIGLNSPNRCSGGGGGASSAGADGAPGTAGAGAGGDGITTPISGTPQTYGGGGGGNISAVPGTGGGQGGSGNAPLGQGNLAPAGTGKPQSNGTEFKGGGGGGGSDTWGGDGGSGVVVIKFVG